ncbi:MAG: hypothetical protein J3K34DRAFT_497437 [Monoraphidium minutum]|nr:MAG: hypothetical protein J3K34DRAFT_497437 [Monoraphidium minutum]
MDCASAAALVDDDGSGGAAGAAFAAAAEGGGGKASAAPPRLAGLPEAELDAVVCALEPRHRRPLRLACRALCRAVDARLGRVVVAAAAPRHGGAPCGLPLSALPQLAARFPRASCVKLQATVYDEDAYAITPQAMEAVKRKAFAADAAALAAALRALPSRAWPAVEAVAGRALGRGAILDEAGPLRRPALLELARLCPRLRAAEGLAVSAGVVWAREPRGWAALLPLTRLSLVLDGSGAPAPEALAAAAAEVLAALFGLRDLGLVQERGPAAAAGALRACAGAPLERLALKVVDVRAALAPLRERAAAGTPLAALTHLELVNWGPHRDLSGADVAAIAAAGPALRELKLGVDLEPAGDWSGAVLPRLTLLSTISDLAQSGVPLRRWAPALADLKVNLWSDNPCPLHVLVPHPALRQLEVDARGPDESHAHAADTWMRAVARLRGLTEVVFGFSDWSFDLGEADSDYDDSGNEEAGGGGGGGAQQGGGAAGAGGGAGGGEGPLGGGGGSGGGAVGCHLDRDQRLMLCCFHRWALRWPRLQSLALLSEVLPLPATQLLAALCGAPLAASLTKLEVVGVMLGPEADAARALLFLPAFPRLETLDLFFDGLSTPSWAALRALVAPLAGARPVVGGPWPHVMVRIPRAWLQPHGPLLPADCEALGASCRQLSVFYSERGVDADDTAPRLAGLPEAELDAIVCALEPRHRRPLRLASRRLCRAVDARLGRVAVAAAAPRPQGEGGAGAAPRGLPLPALPGLAARFPRASCVVLNARRVPRGSLPSAFDEDDEDEVAVATNEELAVDAAALAAALRALPGGAWPGVEAAEGGTARFDLPASYERTGPLRPAVLLELARLCPRLSSASGLVIAGDAAGWGAPAAAGAAAAPAGGAPPLPPSLASVTRLGLHLFSFPGDYSKASPGPATAEVLSALPGLRELRVRGAPPDPHTWRALWGCGALERLVVEGWTPSSVLLHMLDRVKAGEPLAALTSLEMRYVLHPMRAPEEGPELRGDDLLVLSAACPALRDLALDGVLLSNLYDRDDYEESGASPLFGLTRLCTGFNLMKCAPLREMAPAVHTLVVRDTQDMGLWRAAAAPPPALRRLEFEATRGGRESARMVGSWMAGVSALTGLTALELRFGGGALAEEPPPPPPRGSGGGINLRSLRSLCAVIIHGCVEGYGEESSDDDSGAVDGGAEDGGAEDGGEEAGAALARIRGWAALWPPLRSLSIEVAGVRLPAAELLAALRGAPLAGTLAELRLAGVVLGAEEEAARTVACMREFPALDSFDLRLGPDGGDRAEGIGALRAFAAPPTGLGRHRQLAGVGAGPRVTLGIPEAWMRPRAPLSWAECEGLGAAHPLLSVVID